VGKKNIRNETRAKLYKACNDAGIEILWNVPCEKVPPANKEMSDHCRRLSGARKLRI
jgi:hypothetical protein